MTRRDALRRLAMALTAAGAVDHVAAQEVHRFASQAAAAAGGSYKRCPPTSTGRSNGLPI
jgi:hypothetical protein